MNSASLIKELIYQEKKPDVQLLFETDFSKELRIALKEGQVMKEHQTPFPIVVELFEGKLDFGAEGEIHPLERGDILTLPANVPHDLKALQDSIVRLSISKTDTADRVKQVAEDS